MNGGADLGGMQGFGPVVEDPNEPQYHAEWESRVMGMVVAMGACGQWNIDLSRHAREVLPPTEYMSSPYYKIWTEGLQRLLLERDMVTTEELQTGRLSVPPIPVKATLAAGDVWDGLHSLSGSADRPSKSEARFKVGDRVTTINSHPIGHTRLPRYARGKQGTITDIIGHHVFPDSAGNGLGDNPQWLYQVTFAASELWGAQANEKDTVSVDLWEPHFV